MLWLKNKKANQNKKRKEGRVLKEWQQLWQNKIEHWKKLVHKKVKKSRKGFQKIFKRQFLEEVKN